ncbi:MAG: NPCBM/NEW2 domain-containing protein [Planctomycetota bacterium]|jgi:hypothetical protein
MSSFVRAISAVFVLSFTIMFSVAAADMSGITVYDFEDGSLPAGAKISSSGFGKNAKYTPSVELEKNGNNTVLELGKNAVMTLDDKEYLNFSIEATVRREYNESQSQIGFQFRNGYKVYIRKPGRVELIGPNKAKGRGFTRNRSTFEGLKFKIVVVGPVVRFFVDNKYEGQFDNLELTPGPIAVYQKGVQHNCYIDDIKINTNLKPEQFLACEVVPAADNAMVFDPSKNVSFKFKVTNHYSASQEAEVGIDLATFADKSVYNGLAAPASIGAGETKEVALDLGKIPEGYYRLKFLTTGKISPLAVHKKGAVKESEYKKPLIMTGVYWYYMGFKGLPDVWWNTYMHAACNDLKKHNFNTIIACPGLPLGSIKIAGSYGIRIFTRLNGGGTVTDPNVLGGFIGDEPHKGDEDKYMKQYTGLINKYPDKIWTTCMIGDKGVKHCQPWWDAWKPLSKNDNVVRMLRWYGIKKFQVGLKRTYSNLRPLTEVLRDLSQGEGPYYFIMPSFGKNIGIKSYFSNPLPAQIRGMMHLAAAHQAKALFFWTYQTPFPDHDAFVDPATLLPLDDKWEAAGKAAGNIIKNAELLANCTWNSRYSYIDGPNLLDAFELKRKDDPAKYFYVINQDTERPVNGRLFELDTRNKLQNLFTGEDVPISEGTVQLIRHDQKAVGGTAHISLLAGDGVLLKYTEAEVKKEALPRVTYPAEAADMSENKIIWLDTVAPLEMPVPGWYPAVKFRNKTWFPDFNSKETKLYSGADDEGQLYKHSLWAHAETSIKYKIPAGVKTFAAAAGFANKDEKSSAVFRVLVDGKEKYNSGVMRLGTPVKPVVVDLSGGKTFELLTEEAGDGLYGDYTFWGEARLVKK